jgi:formate hydrogenlyase subunit 6/NADH:ubiquinone oxidoreductase subunit I
MADNWYPIIKGNCIKCKQCIEKCPIHNIEMINNQIIINNGFGCPDSCEVCKDTCAYNAVAYYDGTDESIMNAFGGECHCHSHK